ncbi:hypothetical protein GXB85_04550 [Cellulomonas sp. APG4]|uniref:hypothetical protein n=1 Tax=Cellulomonas sp. APG4 TaxID=1538656 RepID=UPI00137ACA78|nr:hypothetical protein [Cellulomonas sp. APG4]NCT90224.1 hypothetical protein [Cellulomonas sp. APG4]
MATTPHSVPVSVFIELRVGGQVLSPGAVVIGNIDAKVTRTEAGVDVDQTALARGLARVLTQTAADARFTADVIAAQAPGGAS